MIKNLGLRCIMKQKNTMKIVLFCMLLLYTWINSGFPSSAVQINKTNGVQNTTDAESTASNFTRSFNNSACSDGWIYHRNPFTQGSLNDGLFRTRMDGTSTEYLDSDVPGYINADKNWIYYANMKYANNLYALTDQDKSEQVILKDSIDYGLTFKQFLYYVDFGKSIQRTELASGKVKKIGQISSNWYSADGNKPFVIVSNFIYYIGEDSLNRCKLDGDDNQVLCKVSNAIGLDVMNGTIVVYHSNGIFKINASSLSETVISNSPLQNGTFEINNGWIYVFNISNISRIHIESGEVQNLTHTGYHIQGGWQCYQIAGEYIYMSNGEGFRKMKLDGSEKTCLNGSIHGDFIMKQDWVYFTENLGFFKCKIDGSSLAQLSYDRIDKFMQNGNWIYYINQSDNSIVYRMDMNGMKRTQMSKSPADKLIQGSNAVWFTRTLNNNIIKLSTDGHKRIVLNEDESYDVTLRKDKLYYINHSDGDRIYCMNTDGSGKTRLNDHFSHNLSISNDGWIYYVCQEDYDNIYLNCTDNGTMYRMKIDGSEDGPVSRDYMIEHPVSSGDWTYFINELDHHSIYKINHDESKCQKVVDESCTSICMLQGYIYYINSRDHHIYRMNTDGSEVKSISDRYAEVILSDGSALYFSTFEPSIEPSKEFETGYSYMNILYPCGAIYRTNVDGTDTVTLLSEKAKLAAVQDHSIYYFKYDVNPGTLCNHVEIRKMGTDGTTDALLKENFPSITDHTFIHSTLDDFLISNDKIYGIHYADGQIEDLNRNAIAASKASKLLFINRDIDGDWIYYNNLLDHNLIYKVNVQSGKEIKVADFEAGSVCQWGGSLYIYDLYPFTSSDCNNVILPLNLEAERRTLFNLTCNNYVLEGDQLYLGKYHDVQSDNQSNFYEALSIRQYHMDNGNYNVLTEKAAKASFFVYNSALYYRDITNNSFNKIDAHGNNIKMNQDNHAFILLLTGDWVYSFQYNQLAGKDDLIRFNLKNEKKDTFTFDYGKIKWDLLLTQPK